MNKFLFLLSMMTLSFSSYSRESNLPDFVELAKLTGPAVVNIVARDNADDSET